VLVIQGSSAPDNWVRCEDCNTPAQAGICFGCWEKRRNQIKYPPVPPEEPEQGEVLMFRPGMKWHAGLSTWLPETDPRLPFPFPGKPHQVYRQAMRTIQRENFPCKGCGKCLDCLRLENS
jgi:hypothetical protein